MPVLTTREVSDGIEIVHSAQAFKPRDMFLAMLIYLTFDLRRRVLALAFSDSAERKAEDALLFVPCMDL